MYYCCLHRGVGHELRYQRPCCSCNHGSTMHATPHSVSQKSVETHIDSEVTAHSSRDSSRSSTSQRRCRSGSQSWLQPTPCPETGPASQPGIVSLIPTEHKATNQSTLNMLQLLIHCCVGLPCCSQSLTIPRTLLHLKAAEELWMRCTINHIIDPNNTGKLQVHGFWPCDVQSPSPSRGTPAGSQPLPFPTQASRPC